MYVFECLSRNMETAASKMDKVLARSQAQMPIGSLHLRLSGS